MIINSTNIWNEQSPLILTELTEHKKDHNTWRWQSRSWTCQPSLSPGPGNANPPSLQVLAFSTRPLSRSWTFQPSLSPGPGHSNPPSIQVLDMPTLPLSRSWTCQPSLSPSPGHTNPPLSRSWTCQPSLPPGPGHANPPSLQMQYILKQTIKYLHRFASTKKDHMLWQKWMIT